MTLGKVWKIIGDLGVNKLSVVQEGGLRNSQYMGVCIAQQTSEPIRQQVPQTWGKL